MALKRVDEFDQTTEADIVNFSVEGTQYEIDLSRESRTELYRALDRYIKAARRKGQTKRSHKAPPGRADQMNAIRDWARKQGYDVSPRGRVPREIKDKFEAEHKSTPAFSS